MKPDPRADRRLSQMTLPFVLVAMSQLTFLIIAIGTNRCIALAAVNAAVAVSITAMHFHAVTTSNRSGRFVETWKSIYPTAMPFTMCLYGALMYERSDHGPIFAFCAGLFALSLLLAAHNSWRSLKTHRLV